MSDGEEEAAAAGSGRVQILEPARDLQTNWELNLAKYLEDYLLKICSGEIDDAASEINFAEAALLLQGSVQVYSKKVEYLYALVLHAMEFLSQKRQDQEEKVSRQNEEGTESSNDVVEENEPFLGLDDVPVDAKNCLDGGLNHGESSSHFVKPPANLLVLEGDCLDTSGAASELESYLLATCDFFGDFLLLDPCDAGAVYNYLKTDAVDKEPIGSHRGGSHRSKTHHSVFHSPNVRSVGAPPKSLLGKNGDANLNQTSKSNCTFEVNNDNIWSPHQEHSFPEDYGDHLDEPNVGCSNIGDDSDDDNEDPWKPLNPHEPGNLKIKPYKKGRASGRQGFRKSKQNSLSSQFPIAQLDGFIRKEFAESFEVQLRLQETTNKSETPPLYEKLRRSLAFGLQEASFGFDGVEDENDENGGDNDIPDFEPAGFDTSQEFTNMDTDAPLYQGTQSDSAANNDGPEGVSQDNLDSNACLEDLCRSHLDSLLASIAESEKQTEMAARVSTWKQRIEHNLEEQDKHPPFDIHLYGDRVLDTLSSEVGSGGSMSFTDVVRGQPKHDVARTFSALLQLVNNGNVELQRASSSAVVCYTSANPFHVRLLRHPKRREESQIPSAKKVRLSARKASSKAPEVSSPHQNGRTAVHIRKANIIRFTPEAKRRRRPDDLNFS